MHAESSHLGIMVRNALAFSAQHTRTLLHSLCETLDISFIVKTGKGGPEGSGDAKAGHEWLAAMVAGADGHAQFIDESTEVVVVDALHVEGERPGTITGTMEFDTLDA